MLAPGVEHPTVFTGYTTIEFVIDRPVAEVWPQYLDQRSWITSHQLDAVHGEPGTVGSIIRPSPKDNRVEELGLPPPHHHYCKILKVVPEREYVFKTYSEEGGSYGLEMVAFDLVRFVEIDRKTKITFDYFAHYAGDSIAEMNEAERDALMEASRKGMLKNLGNLKEMIESR